jgi:hypothetical protein
MIQTFRHLDADRLIETAERLAKRVAERFPTSGLTRVADRMVEVTRWAVSTSESIQRPNWPLRVGLVLVGALIVGMAVFAGVVELGNAPSPGAKALEFMRATQGAVVYFGVVFFFFWSLEARFKRGKAVKAVHELRALAHIIDMHQLTKDPDRVGRPADPSSTDGPMSAEAVGQYLHYCTEMLAVISKIGQLYVQDFPDGTALAAVDQFENLATGLSQKIWQKIMILDRLRDEQRGPEGARPNQAG